MRRYEVVAHNTAVVSDNKIHDDDVARRLGFAGGLVPGVDVFAYLTHPVVENWGTAWLAGGAVEVRFLVPVYDGRRTTITSGPVEDGVVVVRALDDTGTECATATFSLPAATNTAPAADDWAVAARPEHRPDASPEAFEAYDSAGCLPTLYLTLEEEAASAYLDDVRESIELYREQGAPAHPGWLLRRANDALVAAVKLGPWIHVGSTIRHHGLVRRADTVETRSRVIRWWESKGHHFVTVDVALVVEGEVRTTIDHTAIYRPRDAP